MMPAPDRPHYRHQRRNGYSAIDFFRGECCIRLVCILDTQKDAILLTAALNDAIEQGMQYQTLLTTWERSFV